MTATEPPDVPGNPAGFIRSLISEGEGPTAGLRIFRDAGGSIGNDRWFALYHQTADTLANSPQALGLDPYSLPNPGEYTPWALGKGNQYMTQVKITLYNRGSGDFVTSEYTHVTSDPHTPAEAEEAAMDNFDPENTGADYDQIAMGAVATDVAFTVPYGSI